MSLWWMILPVLSTKNRNITLRNSIILEDLSQLLMIFIAREKKEYIQKNVKNNILNYVSHYNKLRMIHCKIIYSYLISIIYVIGNRKCSSHLTLLSPQYQMPNFIAKSCKCCPKATLAWSNTSSA